MKPNIGSFLEKIPQNIRLDSREYLGRHMAVFEPKEYVTGQKLYCDHYHFVLLFSPPPVMKIGRTEYQFQKGSLISLEPGMELSILPYNSRLTGKYMSMSINKQFFKRVALQASDKESISLRKLDSGFSNRLLDIVGNFKQELLNYGDEYPMLLQSIETQAVFQLLREINEDIYAQRRKSTVNLKYVNKAVEYIQNNYSSVITLDDISREVYASPDHFERIFKYQTGQTPHQYLIGVRLQKAKEILKRDECSIEEAARRCGFVNASHFSTTFKRIIGMPPSEFKKKLY